MTDAKRLRDTQVNSLFGCLMAAVESRSGKELVGNSLTNSQMLLASAWALFTAEQRRAFFADKDVAEIVDRYID